MASGHRHAFGLLLLLLSCEPHGALKHTAVAPKTAPQDAAREPWASESLPQERLIAEEVTLENVSPDGFLVVLHPGAHLRIVEVRGQTAIVTLLDYAVADKRLERAADGGWGEVNEFPSKTEISGEIPLSALGYEGAFSLEQPRACSHFAGPGRMAQNFRRLLAATPGGTGLAISTNGGDIEIQESRVIAGHEFQRLRQISGGVELSGWTPFPLQRAWGDFACPARTVVIPSDWRYRSSDPVPHFYSKGNKLEAARLRPGVEWSPQLSMSDHFAHDGLLDALEPPILPTEYATTDAARVRDAVAAFHSAEQLYGVVSFDEQARCATLRLSSANLTIHSDSVEDGVLGQVELKYECTGPSSTGRIELSGPTLRTPADGARAPRVSLRTQDWWLVAAGPLGFDFVPSSATLFGYHREDVSTLYRTQEACEAVLQALPTRPAAARANRARTLSAPRTFPAMAAGAQALGR